MRFLSRARGKTLRLARNRPLAASIGGLLAAPAAWIEWSGRYDAWWIQGLALVLGATGLAFLWTALTGVPPDWVDD
jgi:hypothetical protein